MRKQLLLSIVTCAALSAACFVQIARAGGAGPGLAPGGAPGMAAPGGRAGGGAAAPGGVARGRAGGGGMGRGAPPGPPAPVPPEVAIPRPTADELARINAALQRFVQTDADKDFLKKYSNLINIPMPPDNPCIRPTVPSGGRHTQLVELAQTGDYDIMFIGDSITELLGTNADPQGNPGGKPQVDKYFADVKVGNFGISGDSTQGVLGRFQNGEGQGRKPKAVMLMIGTNNNGQTAVQIAEGIGAIILELRKDFPEAKILLVGIFPRGASPTDSGRIKVAECNKIISRLEDKKSVFFLDLTPNMLTPEGRLIGFRPTDNLHPVTEGFDIWLSNAAPILKSWVK